MGDPNPYAYRGEPVTRLTWNGIELTVDGEGFDLAHSIATAISTGAIITVLYDPDAAPGNVGVFENLVGVRHDGGVAWTADVPTSTTGDCYLDVHLGI